MKRIIKCFKQGVYLRDIYPHANWIQTKWFRLAQWIGHEVRVTVDFIVYWTKLTLKAGVLVALGAFIWGNFIGASTVIVNADSQDNLAAKIDQMQNEVVNEIARLENRTNIPIVIDDNKAGTLPRKDKVSIGCMQFKIGTIQHYYTVLKKGTISDTDAIVLALDCDKAKALGKEVIFKTQGGLWNWSVATKEMGTKVEVIKSLSK